MEPEILNKTLFISLVVLAKLQITLAKDVVSKIKGIKKQLSNFRIKRIVSDVFSKFYLSMLQQKRQEESLPQRTMCVGFHFLVVQDGCFL